MKWHPDGMILAAGTQGHAVDVWDIKEQKVVATLLGHQGSVEDWDGALTMPVLRCGLILTRLRVFQCI